MEAEAETEVEVEAEELVGGIGESSGSGPE